MGLKYTAYFREKIEEAKISSLLPSTFPPPYDKCLTKDQNEAIQIVWKIGNNWKKLPPEQVVENQLTLIGACLNMIIHPA